MCAHLKNIAVYFSHECCLKKVTLNKLNVGAGFYIIHQKLIPVTRPTAKLPNMENPQHSFIRYRLSFLDHKNPSFSLVRNKISMSRTVNKQKLH